MYEYDLEYTFTKHNKPYTVNIKTSYTDIILNKKIYPVNTKKKQYKAIKSVNNYDICKYHNYLYKLPSNVGNKKDKTEILQFKFEHRLGMCIYAVCFDKIKPHQNKFLLICKIPMIMDAIIYIYKYVLSVKPILTVLQDNKYNDDVDRLFEQYNVNNKFIKDKVNNEWLENNASIVDNVDIAIVDYIIRINGLSAYRGLYQLNAMNGRIILALKKLNKDGMLIIVSTLFTNVFEFQYYNFLSYFFDKIQIKNLIPESRGDGYNLIFIICSGYNGMADFQTLLELNKMIYTIYSDTYNYVLPFNPQIESTVTDKISDGTQQYITNFVDIPNIKYKKFKNFQKKYLKNDIYNIYVHDILNKFGNDNTCSVLKTYTILLAKKLKLPLLSWYDNNNYIEELHKKFSDLSTNIRIQLKYTKKVFIEKNDSVIIKNHKHIDNLMRLVKKAYVYVEQYDEKAFNVVQQWFYDKYKELNKFLSIRKILINNKDVSIQWIKIYETIYETKILESCKNATKIKIFHTCEPSGNFINAIDHYMKKYLPNINHEWVAQTLKSELTDTYGFIEKTKKQWDYGTDDTGDIITSNNFEYYYSKYKDCDIYISYCGQESPSIKNKSVVAQLIYALLLPRIGGGFIINIQNCTKFNHLELSLIYIISNKYKNVKVFRSNTTFWSTEIYIIGYNKIEILDREKKIIYDCIYSDTYPVKKISSKFIKKYVKLIKKITLESIRYHNYFLYLSINKEAFNKKLIERYILTHIGTWIGKYIEK